MIVSKLINLLPPPLQVEKYKHDDWENVENKYDISIPQDYKNIIENYGSGCIDGFIWLLNPFSNNSNINFSMSEYFINEYLYLRIDFPGRYVRPLYPESESFFPWAVTESGEVLAWIIDGSTPPDEWPVAIFNNNLDEEEVYNLTSTELLIKLLSRTLRSELLPERFPSNGVYFEPFEHYYIAKTQHEPNMNTPLSIGSVSLCFNHLR